MTVNESNSNVQNFKKKSIDAQKRYRERQKLKRIEIEEEVANLTRRVAEPQATQDSLQRENKVLKEQAELAQARQACFLADIKQLSALMWVENWSHFMLVVYGHDHNFTESCDVHSRKSLNVTAQTPWPKEMSFISFRTSKISAYRLPTLLRNWAISPGIGPGDQLLYDCSQKKRSVMEELLKNGPKFMQI